MNRYVKRAIFFSIFLLLPLMNSLVSLETRIEHRQGGGVGYRNQYSKIELYHAFENQAFQPFIDIRYLVLEKGKKGANLGAGLGYQFLRQNRLSLYTYFDLTESKTNHYFNQITTGLSYTHPLLFSKKNLGELACYFNWYFPLKSLEKRIAATSFYKFKGHNLLLSQFNRYALTGGNIELGYLSKKWCLWNFYAAGGAYYFKRSALHAFGGYGKLRLIYNDLVSGEVFVSRDRLFNTKVSGTIGIRIPLGKREMKKIKSKMNCSCNASRPPERFEPIVLKKHTKRITAKDNSNVPLYFIFVNNLSGSDGTFEDPYATLSDAENASLAGQYIYLFPGDGTTANMDQGFTMKDGQTFAGSGTILTVATGEGNVTIPALTSARPKIANTNLGNGVTIGRNCTVSGIVFNGMGQTAEGFYQSISGGTSTLTILRCASKNNTSSGFMVQATNASNVIVNISHCSGNRNEQDGFLYQSTGGATMTATTSDSIANLNTGSGNSQGFAVIVTGAADSYIDAEFLRCSADNNKSVGFQARAFSDSTGSVEYDHCAATENSTGFNIRNSGGDFLLAEFANCTASDGLRGFTIGNTATLEPIFPVLNDCSATGNTVYNFSIAVETTD